MRAGANPIWTRGWPADFAIATGIGLFLAVLGPYGSYLNGPFWQRAAFQLPCAWTALAVIGAGVRLAIARTGDGPWFWALTAAVGAVAMLPVVLVNVVLAWQIWPFLPPHMTLATWYAQGFLVAEPVSFAFAYLALQRYGSLSGVARHQAPTLPPPRPGQAAVNAWPAGLRAADVLCLQMEDHYVRVHAAHGSWLILATLGQALAEMTAAPGLRVHRSWWVADSAVAGSEADGRNVRLVLANGQRVPVARSCIAAARARGWLERSAIAAPPVEPS